MQDDDVYSAIEIERAALRKQGGLTPVTFDTFVAWKERKARERQVVQCVAVCSSVLQCVAVCSSVLQSVVVCCSVL